MGWECFGVGLFFDVVGVKVVLLGFAIVIFCFVLVCCVCFTFTCVGCLCTCFVFLDLLARCFCVLIGLLA